AWPIWPSKAATDAVLMQTPRSPSALGSFFAMAAAPRRIMLKLPIRLTVTIFVKWGSGIGPSLPTVLAAPPMPAQLTTPTSLPMPSAASIAAWPSASDVTSHLMNFALAPSLAACSLPSLSWTSAMTTLPPALTMSSVVAPPRPDAPPVTTTTLPLNSMACLLWGFDCLSRAGPCRAWPGSAALQQGDDEQGDDVDDLDQRVDRGAGGILVGIADGIAGDRRLVGFRALAAMVAVLDVLLGVVPGAAAGAHRDRDEQAGDY